MTSKEAFSQEDWASLVMAGTWIGQAIIIADTPKRVRKELKALRNAFELAATKFPGNGLIGAVLPEAKAAALADIDAKAMYAKKEENMQRILADLRGTAKALKIGRGEGRDGFQEMAFEHRGTDRVGGPRRGVRHDRNARR